MKKIIVFYFLLTGILGFSQKENDTLVPENLDEVIVIGRTARINEKQTKPLASLDEFLQKSNTVDMVKRGAYAWEPLINNMPTERTLVTIDGMRIFGACTDKMDPITSYVEVSNLSEAKVCSGQEGSCFGSTIGGSVDLKRNLNVFGERKWEGWINTGYETNNKQKIVGFSGTYSDKSFYCDTSVMFRDAENYYAGNHEEVQFSQFRKLNLSGTSGFKIGQNKLIEGSVIYDKATDVGYPALPMDVSLAEALITSLKWVYKPLDSKVKNSETKLYYNTITHRMDDTKRPDVAIHMDMPGWSKTAGLYSKWDIDLDDHQLLFNLNSFYNKSLASMTMYPNNPNEPLMFMYTWPDVRTFYSGIFAQDNFVINCHSAIRVSGSLGSHTNEVASEMGLESLKIFYPDMKSSNTRFVKNISANYNVNHNGLEYGFGGGFGDRAPSVSEGYGFYLFNSFDRYDYIGNPNMKNESSLEGNAYVGLKKEQWKFRFNSSYFHISNYIIGVPDPYLLPMTIGANGVKVYSSLDYAVIANVGFTAEIKFLQDFKWEAQVAYARGKDNEGKNLPFISPFSYSSTISYYKNHFSGNMTVLGNATQNYNSPFYGEDRTPAYAILNAGVGYDFRFGKEKLSAKTGMENILDAHYSTYSDWNSIPRMGRNIFLNLSYRL